jgi:hypothetical protein
MRSHVRQGPLGESFEEHRALESLVQRLPAEEPESALFAHDLLDPAMWHVDGRRALRQMRQSSEERP